MYRRRRLFDCPGQVESYKGAGLSTNRRDHSIIRCNLKGILLVLYRIIL